MSVLTSVSNVAAAPIFARHATRSYDGWPDDYLDGGSPRSLNLKSGTISLGFNMDNVGGSFALISKDSRNANNGEFTVWIEDGELVVSIEEAGERKWISVPNFKAEAQTDYHFAMSFGEDGLSIWVNGDLVAAEPEITFDMRGNDSDLLIGGTRAYTSDDGQPHSLFRGEISDVEIYREQLGEDDMMALASEVAPTLDDAARMADFMDDLQPTFEQTHHGSDTLKELMEDYGISHGGHGMAAEGGHSLMMMAGTDAAETMTGTVMAEAMNGYMGNDLINGMGGNDILQGDYGNDTLNGGFGNDILDGGHGEDVLNGGDGNDWLISRSDAREPYVTYDPNRDEGDPLGELTNGKLYPDQPLPADDVMIGGAGADIFYFQLLINAKERYIREHTNRDGTINWHGVAGENDKIHDHWVDAIGHDYVMDFSRAEGDRLIIEGHTVEIASIEYGDANNDGVMDHSIITLYSEQGRNGGAHADDMLGKITVYGDLVKLSDIETTAAPAYGAVTSIEDLEEALTPKDNGTDKGTIAPPADLTRETSPTLPSNATAVYAVTEKASFDGFPGDYMDAGHDVALANASGTVALSFSLDGTAADMALISKDDKGSEEGEFTLYAAHGQLKIKFDKGDGLGSKWMTAPDLMLMANTTYHLAMSFGADGLSLWLNGDLVLSDPEFTLGMGSNDASLVIGGTRAYTDPDNDAHNLFRGDIGDVYVYDKQLGEDDIMALAADVAPALDDAAQMADFMDDLQPTFEQTHHGSDTLKELMEDYGISHGDHGGMSMAGEGGHSLMMRAGTDANETLTGNDMADGINGYMGNDLINGMGGNDILQGDYGNDTLNGGDGDDILDGGHGEDVLNGGNGNDWLISRSDAREPYVTYDPNRDEGDPLGELTNGKLYPDQPLPADDVMIGGAGADIFYFQLFINAKERYIREHTGSDGVINWHGVAGENDKIHDHWVDAIGHDYVMDFSRAEGDRLIIEGHTAEIAYIEYGDSNGDGVMDHSIITLYSEQGNNGGAHADDLLGKITVYGDLVQESDIEHTAKPAYGAITSIEDLEEALTPKDNGTDKGAITKPAWTPSPDEFLSVDGTPPVFAVGGEHSFDPDLRSAMIFEHDPSMAVDAGTIAFNFQADALGDYDFLFSKDATGYGDGGHVSAYVMANGDLYVRIQSDEKSYYLKAQGALEAGVSYDFAFSFGPAGAQLFLNGNRLASISDVKVGLGGNTEDLAVGANKWNSTPGTSDSVHSHFNGTITNFVLYDKQLQGGLGDGTSTPSGPSEMSIAHNSSMCGFSINMIGELVITCGSMRYVVPSSVETLTFADKTINTADIHLGSGASDQLAGSGRKDILFGHTAHDHLVGAADDDLLLGGGGNDTLDGGDGNDVMVGSWGRDSMDGGDGIDTVDYSAAGSGAGIRLDGRANWGFAEGDTIENVENVIGSNHADIIVGSEEDNNIDARSGNDKIYAGLGDDTINGGAGDDEIYAGAGNDLLFGGQGADKMYGHTGIDTVSYAFATQGGGIKLESDEGWGNAAGDLLSGIENVIGSRFKDTIIGSEEDNVIAAGGGHDVVFAGLGNDTIYGGFGNDKIQAGEGDDLLIGGLGADSLYGHAGNDTVSYAAETRGGGVRLESDSGWGHAQGDLLSGIENVIGSRFRDTITGSDKANRLEAGAGDDKVFAGNGHDMVLGGAGNDEIFAGLGADTMNGGEGNDRMFGNAGFDRFVFEDGFGNDVIGDFFAADAEKIDLSGVTNITDFNDLVNGGHLQTDQATGFAMIVDGANSIRLDGVTADQIGSGLAYSESDFIF